MVRLAPARGPRPDQFDQRARRAGCGRCRRVGAPHPFTKGDRVGHNLHSAAHAALTREAHGSSTLLYSLRRPHNGSFC
ncbi:hypothetical protein GCM10027418_14790 [Mariniluteicoccus endophyticus]